MTLIIGLLLFLLAYLSWESWRLRRALRAVPTRIHINGSRGKSSVTRLVAAAMREAGVRTVAKTTGSSARFIHPDGSEEPVIRLGTPNVAEQVGVLDRARRLEAQALVIECMALRPDLQRICEESIVHATLGVITNVRADHLDVMGPTLADVAVTMAATLPHHGTAIVGDSRELDCLQREATKRGSRLIVARPHDLPAGAMDRFDYLEHEENVAVALAVTRTLGIPDPVSLSGMAGARPDPGACTRWMIEHQGQPIEFQNILAANDLESTVAIWQRLGLHESHAGLTVALLNLRGDRIDRSLQFAEVLGNLLPADYYVLVGDLSARIRRRFEHRLPAERLLTLGRMQPARIFDRMAALEPGGAPLRVGAVGNIGGLGHELLDFVAHCPPASGGTTC